MGKTKKHSDNVGKAAAVRPGRPSGRFGMNWNPIEKSAKVSAVAGVAVGTRVAAVAAVVAGSNAAFVHHAHQTHKPTAVSKGSEMTIVKEEENPQFQMKIFLLGKVLEEGFTKEVEGLFGENKDFMKGFAGKTKEEIKQALEDLINKYDSFSKKRLKLTS